MDKYKRFYGVITFVVALLLLIFAIYKPLSARIVELSNLETGVENAERKLKDNQNKLEIVQRKIKKIKDSIATSQKKIYSPIEADLGNETLFFTLYNDVIEMVHANSVKIKSINYTYNPETDAFVKFGKDIYFVCDIEMELASNYVNLGKLIQDIYQYPYYIKINELDVKPYAKDKTVLLSKLSLRLYAHTSPEEEVSETTAPPALGGGSIPLPQ